MNMAALSSASILDLLHELFDDALAWGIAEQRVLRLMI